MLVIFMCFLRVEFISKSAKLLILLNRMDVYFINCLKIVEIMVQITQNTYGNGGALNISLKAHLLRYQPNIFLKIIY